MKRLTYPNMLFTIIPAAVELAKRSGDQPTARESLAVEVDQCRGFLVAVTVMM